MLEKTEGRRRRGRQRMRWLDGDGHGFEQALGVGDGQGSLSCCSPWGRKESDTTEGLIFFTTDVLYVTGSSLPVVFFIFWS